MDILDALWKTDRKFWFVCYKCVQLTSHDALKSIFYSTGSPVEIHGRNMTSCPRCQSANTVSFQKLKENGSEVQLWGLEQIARKHPRSFFEVHPTAAKGAT